MLNYRDKGFTFSSFNFDQVVLWFRGDLSFCPSFFKDSKIVAVDGRASRELV